MTEQALTPLSPEEQMARVTEVQTRYADMLMHKRFVIGVGVGLASEPHPVAFIYCLVVLVSMKVPPDQLEPEDRIPEELDGVPVEVREVGTFTAQA